MTPRSGSDVPFPGVSAPELARQQMGSVGLATDEDPELGMLGVVCLREAADALEEYQVGRARQQGLTWAQIGAALGVSAQAAHKRTPATGCHSESADHSGGQAPPFTSSTLADTFCLVGALA